MMEILKSKKKLDWFINSSKYVLITNRDYPQIYEVKPEYEETFKDNLLCYLQEIKLPGLVLGKVYPFELPKHIGERND